MTLFERILETNVINFLIVISSLVLIYKKAHLGNLIEKMANDIKDEVENSSKEASNAQKNYQKIKDEAKEIPKLKGQILLNAQNTALKEKQKIEQNTVLKKEEIKVNLENAKKADEIKYKDKFENEIYEAAFNIAYEKVLEKLDDNLQNKLINDAIEELDKLNFEAVK